MSEKLILTENFGEYKGHIVADVKNTRSCYLYLFTTLKDIYGINTLCKLTKKNIKKRKIDSEIRFLNIDKLNKEIPSVKCKKCIENYNRVLGVIKEEKELSPTQRLMMAVGTNILWLTKSFKVKPINSIAGLEKFHEENNSLGDDKSE
jgi:hypothetical protein